MSATIGSHPGAILFRLAVMVILIAILMLAFFSYLDDNQKALERTSVAQTLRIVDSMLALVFTTYAVRRELGALAEVDGADPFRFVRQFDMVPPPSYRGVAQQRSLDALEPGWHYLAPLGITCYKSRFVTGDRCFRLTLEYDDNDASGRFDYGVDAYRNLRFVEVSPPA